MADESRKTVYVALAMNGVIAVAKLAGGLVSGSAAMLAEGAHSIADTANQGLLLVSLSLGGRPADEAHPFGYGKERFFWTLLVAVLIFTLGGVFSIAEGLYRIVGGESKESYLVAYVVLAVALVAETISFVRAYRQTRSEAAEAGIGLRRFVRVTSNPTAKAVFSEDLAAIAGLLLAFLGVGLNQATGGHFWDPAASIAIGVLLLGVGFLLGRDQKGLLLGEAALPEEREQLREAVEAFPQVRNVVELLTMHIGPRSLLVAARVDFDDGLSGRGIEEIANRIEERMREVVPDVTQVFIDPTPGETETGEASSRGPSSRRGSRAAS